MRVVIEPRDRLVWAILRLTCAAVLLGGCLSSSPGREPAASSKFDGRRAYEHIRELCAIGPRPVDSPGASAARLYIAQQLAAYGLAVREQAFTADTPLGPMPMVNLRVAIPSADSSARGRLIIGGHYDTKLFRGFTFVGANDGGSSTAFLIELARVLTERTNPLPIELVFFDGEEAFVEWQGDDHTYGSRHYVEAARADGSLADIRAVIVVDMVGDRDLRIRREAASTAWLTDLIWSGAKRASQPEFVGAEVSIEDDHVPFLEADVPAALLIDLEYPPWHTADDQLDKVAAESLQAVADALLTALPDIERQIGR